MYKQLYNGDYFTVWSVYYYMPKSQSVKQQNLVAKKVQMILGSKQEIEGGSDRELFILQDLNLPVLPTLSPGGVVSFAPEGRTIWAFTPFGSKIGRIADADLPRLHGIIEGRGHVQDASEKPPRCAIWIKIPSNN